MVCILFTGSLCAQNKMDFSAQTWEQVLKQAKETQKLIYLDCYTAWCGPCKMMDKSVFTNPEVIDFYDKNFLNYKMDMEKGVGPELVEKYKVKVYPTHLFIDGDGNVIHRSISFKNSREFILLGHDAMSTTTQTSSLEKMYVRGNKTPEFLISYVQYLEETSQDHSFAFDQYLKAVPKEEQWSEKNVKLIFKYTDNISSYAYQIFLKTLPEINASFSSNDRQYKYYVLCTNSVKNAAKEKDSLLLEASVKLYREKITHKNCELAISLELYMRYYRISKEYGMLNKEIWSYIDHYITPRENIIHGGDSELLKEIRNGKSSKSIAGYDSKPKTVVVTYNEHAKSLFSFAKMVYYEDMEMDSIQVDAISWLKFAISIEDKLAYYDLLLRFYQKRNTLQLASPYLDILPKLVKKEKHLEEDYAELMQILVSLQIVI